MKKLVFILSTLAVTMFMGCQSSQQTNVNSSETESHVETSVQETTSEVAVTTVAVSETTEYVPSFEDITLALECTYTLDTLLGDNVHFESDSPDIVSVDETGKLTALSVGTANITVSLNNKEYAFEVVVTTPEISETSIRKIAGNTAQLFVYGTNGIPKFKSDNTAIATVSENGMITAAPSGVGQSTKIHTFIDGKEFITEVTVEPVPQLMSSYKIFGYQNEGMYEQDNNYYRFQSANIELAANTNEILILEDKVTTNGEPYKEYQSKTVLNFLELDSDSENQKKYSLYRSYSPNGPEDRIQVYLVGSSQNANVMLKLYNGNEVKGNVTYTPDDGFGVVEISGCYCDSPVIVSVQIDGLLYEFAVKSFDGNNSFRYAGPDEEAVKLMTRPNTSILNCSVDDEKFQFSSSDMIRQKSSTFWGSEAVADIGSTIVEAVQDEAISYVVGKVFSLMF